MRNILQQYYTPEQVGPMQPGIEREPASFDRPGAAQKLMGAGFIDEGTKLSMPAGGFPADVQSYQYWKDLPTKEAQENFLRVKRTQKYLDVGSGYVAPSMTDPTQVIPIAERELKPTETTEYISEKTSAQKAAELKAKKIAQKPKAGLSLGMAEQRATRVSDAIDKAISEVNAWTVGPAAKTSRIAGTPAHDLAATLNTIKANIGFDELNAMRQASPTGGALGQVSERELGFLQSVLASLDQTQSPTQLRENLAKAKNEIKESWKRINAAYEEDYGRPLEGPEVGTVQDGYKFMGGDPASPNSWKKQ
jgi:hypothetical protein